MKEQNIIPTYTVDECIELLRIAIRNNVDETLKDKIFSNTKVVDTSCIDKYEVIRKCFKVVAIAKEFGIGKELNEYIERVNKKETDVLISKISKRIYKIINEEFSGELNEKN